MEEFENLGLSLESSNWFIVQRAWPHILEMLEARGFYDKREQLPKSFHSSFGQEGEEGFRKLCVNESALEAKPPCFILESNSKKKIAVSFYECDEKIGIKSIRYILEWVKNQNSLMDGALSTLINNIILFSHKGVTHFSIKVAREYDDCHLRVSEFRYQEFMYSIIKHPLLEGHKILTEKELNEVCKTLKTKKDNLPGISLNDRLVRYYGLVVGDAIKFSRHTIPNQECSSIYIRIVRDI